MELTEAIRQKLDNYHEIDREYIEVKNRLANNSEFQHFQKLASSRNSEIDSLSSLLKVHLRKLAGADERQGREKIGEFTLTPTRNKWWDKDKLVEASEKMGLLELLVNEQAVNIEYIYEFDMEAATAQGKVKELEDAKILVPIPQYECDATLMETLLSSEDWKTLKARAYNSEIRSVACSMPTKTILA